jgi:hypothetical protein
MVEDIKDSGKMVNNMGRDVIQEKKKRSKVFGKMAKYWLCLQQKK